ncbi:MAG: DISARM system phospholipase D-like protein DrmC [Thermoguttaceae bacterium]|jgi:phosphatidylserine/phosphatidylglycerophosphate/cardiolipin synthase-like enzyme
MKLAAAQHDIATSAGNLATILPFPVMQLLAEAVITCQPDDWPMARNQVVQCLSHPYYRSLAADFLDAWRASGPQLPAQAVAMALLTAAHAEETHRKSQSLELVWTGPDGGGGPFRHTEQAILQVLDSAKERITLVSYAVYRIPHVRESLVRATGRGVRIKVILETPNKCEGQNEYDTLQALGNQVASCATVYYWPESHRPKGDNDKHGILHVKCAVADGRWLFLSSANLTEQAFTINMELGLLLTGGMLPSQVEEQFERLIGMGILEEV